MLPQNAIEGGADAVKDDEPANSCDETRQNTAGIHQYVEKKDINDDRTDQRERQRHIAVGEKKEPASKLEQENGDYIVRGGQRADELEGQRGHRHHRDEMEKSIQAEDGKYKPQ